MPRFHIQIQEQVLVRFQVLVQVSFQFVNLEIPTGREFSWGSWMGNCFNPDTPAENVNDPESVIIPSLIRSLGLPIRVLVALARSN